MISPLAPVKTFLNGVHQNTCDICSESVIQLPDAGWAGHIDFSKIITNDVQTHKHQTFFFYDRGHSRTDLPVSGCELAPLAPATGRQIAAILALRGNSRKRVRHCFALDHQNALVAVADFRNVFLGHGLMSTIVGQGFNNHTQIKVVFLDAENRMATHTCLLYTSDAADDL